MRAVAGLALGVLQFATGVQQEFALTVIDSAADKAALLTAVSGMSRGGFGNLTRRLVERLQG